MLGTLERERRLERLREAVELLEALDRAAGARQGAGRARLRAAPRAAPDARRASRCGARSSWPACCGADALAEHVRAELHAAGARPRRDALSGVESLTPSERRVADLAAGGTTNRDIAQELYVTPKTVEVHLSNAYRKLGIRSRRELERALAVANPQRPSWGQTPSG